MLFENNRRKGGRQRVSHPGEGGEDGGGVEDVLLNLNAGVEGLRGIAGEDGYKGLHDDLAAVHAGIDVMDGAAGLGDSGLESLLPGLNAGEVRKECGVNVENAVGERLQEGLFDEPHEAGQANQVYAEGLQLSRDLGLQLKRKLVFVTAAVHILGRDTAAASTLQDESILMIGENDDDLGIQTPIIDGVEDGLTVAAATGPQNS